MSGLEKEVPEFERVVESPSEEECAKIDCKMQTESEAKTPALEIAVEETATKAPDLMEEESNLDDGLKRRSVSTQYNDRDYMPKEQWTVKTELIEESIHFFNLGNEERKTFRELHGFDSSYSDYEILCLRFSEALASFPYHERREAKFLIIDRLRRIERAINNNFIVYFRPNPQE